MDLDKLISEHNGIQLDIACGANKQKGFVGIDMQDLPGVDIIHDLNVHPWPLPDECVVRAFASHIIEHIPKVVIDGGKTRFPLIEFMDEVWRILRPDAQFAIAGPHAHSEGFAQDPTHASALNQITWTYFDPTHPTGFWKFYRPKPWKLEQASWDPAGNFEVVMRKMLLEKENENESTNL